MGCEVKRLSGQERCCLGPGHGPQRGGERTQEEHSRHTVPGPITLLQHIHLSGKFKK
jgi:hypothetical protein